MRKAGQSLNDYFLPLALVGVVGIVSLSLIGSNLSDLFSNMIGKKKNTAVAATANAAAVPTNALTSQTNTSLSNLPGQTVTINLGNGKSLKLDYADPVAAAESAGGNGVTENALAVLQQVINQLREQGEDETKVAALEKLAQEGHKIKNLQKQIEDLFPTKGFSDQESRYAFLIDPANSIIVDGQSMTLMQAASSLHHYNYTFTNEEDRFKLNAENYTKFNYDNSFETYDYNNLSNESTRINSFMAQLQAVENSGLLDNPALKRLVKEELARDIFTSSSQTYAAPNKTEVAALVKTTRNSSNNICTLANSATCQDRG